MSFNAFVAGALAEPFEKLDTGIVFESIDCKTGSFLRVSAKDEPHVAWFITTSEGFLRVSDDQEIVLEGKYQSFVKEQEA